MENSQLGDPSGQAIVHSVIARQITVRTPAFPAWDVNEDGIVNIFDLILVAQSFGVQPPPTSRADVKPDGRVDIFDLIVVAQHFGESTSAAGPTAVQVLDARYALMLHRWLIEVQAVDDGSQAFRHSIAVLEDLLNRIAPERSSLLPNYPNPFNPETWMPYQLSEPGKVIIEIYTIVGQLVRTLDIGQRGPGSYVTQKQAAYWAGRNNAGEKVSSGIYFYFMRTDNSTTMRKLTVSK